MKHLVLADAWLKLLDSRISELHPKAKKLKRLLENDETIYITGPIIQKVMHNIEDSEKKDRVHELLHTMEYLEILPEDYYAAAFLEGKDEFVNLHIALAERISAKLVD